jgi:hypothetical protein
MAEPYPGYLKIRRKVLNWMVTTGKGPKGYLYRATWYDPPKASLTGKPEHRYELLIAKWNGEKWEAVAFGSMPSIAKKLGLIQKSWAVGQDIKA